MTDDKKIVVIAGPNGAGKTTFATEFLPNEADCPIFVNAGSHRRRAESFSFRPGCRPGSQTDAEADRRARAARTQLRLRDDVERTQLCAPDSALAGGRLPGEAVLSAPAHARGRNRTSRQRVSEGGHDVPEPVIRRRFHAGSRNFERIYRDLVDAWAVFDNSGGAPKLIAEGSRE